MSTKNRGMLLELIINKTINLYKNNNVAIFHKKFVPIRFKTEKNSNKIKTAIIVGKSTADYYGFYKGTFVAFEAKSTEARKLPLNNIKKHQQKYLDLVNSHNGLGFYILYFKINDSFYFLHSENIKKLKSKNIDRLFLEKYAIELVLEYPGIIDFLSAIKIYIKK